MSNPSPTIPLNEEHLEAVQASVNDERATLKEAMSPEARARLEVIEDCSRRLEEAKVPFLLYAANEQHEDGLPTGFWRFNKLVYGVSDVTQDVLFTQKAIHILAKQMLPLCSYGHAGILVSLDHNGQVIAFLRHGKVYTPEEWKEMERKDEENQS